MSLFLVMSGPAIADYQFTVIDLASPNATYVIGINNAGQIVGAFEDDSHHTHGFLDGVTIDVPGATNTSVNGINDAGQVVGNHSGDHYISRGFMWSSDGGFTTIDVSEVDLTFANGINNADQIVGNVGRNGFLLSDGQITPIGFFGAAGTAVFGINNAGLIVGSTRYDFSNQWSFVQTSDGQIVNGYISVPGAEFTDASGINDTGDVAGAYYDGHYHGFLLRNGEFTPVDVPDSAGTYATGINNAGVIVGYFYAADSQLPIRGFIATPQ